jgi:hypothetical protein
MSPDEVERLQKLAEDAAGAEPSIPAAIAALVKPIAAEGIDPWPVIGALLEGAAYLIWETLPAERRGQAMVAALVLLRDRLCR